MIQKDYLMRVIEETAKVIARLLKLETEGDEQAIRELSKEIANNYSGLTFYEFEDIDEDNLLQSLEDRNIHSLEFTALAEIGILDFKKKRKEANLVEAKKALSKAIALLERGIEKNDAFLLEETQKLKTWKTWLLELNS